MSEASENLAVRPLILGADGLVGQLLTDVLEDRYPHLVSATKAELDITDPFRIAAEIERLEPNVLINAAAISDVDACEKDPEEAFRINGQAPSDLAQICRHTGLRLIHLSTDYVFDGETKREYDEADAPNPINVYGKSKLAGEVGVLDTLVDAVVLRISFVFGPGRPTFLDHIARKLAFESGPLPVFDSWISRPTYTLDLASAMKQVLESEETGVWHFANPPAGTRAEFARGVAELLGADPSRIVPVDPGTASLEAPRPPKTPLATQRFEARFGGPLRSWKDAAREYLHLHPPVEAAP